MTQREVLEKYETDQPWCIWRYGRTHDAWWPLWSSTRVLGRFAVDASCMVCGKRERLWVRIPRVGPVPEPPGGKHPARVAFLKRHVHPDRGHPMSWVRPLENMAAHSGGLDLDMLAMRLEADMSEGIPDE